MHEPSFETWLPKDHSVRAELELAPGPSRKRSRSSSSPSYSDATTFSDGEPATSESPERNPEYLIARLEDIEVEIDTLHADREDKEVLISKLQDSLAALENEIVVLQLRVDDAEARQAEDHAQIQSILARLGLDGSTQLKVVDVDDTFSSVVKPGTIRIVLSLAASRHWPIHQLGTDNAYLLLYVDDIVLTASSKILLQHIIRSLHQEFAMTDQDPHNYFLDYGLQLFSSSTTNLVAFSDADWASCTTIRRSTSGYCVFLGSNLLSWSSKRHLTLSHSSVEAEYRGIANAVAEAFGYAIHYDLVAASQVRMLHVPSHY
nr:ribonuclease H-like domain-containing protein [Tanacetum cinerariifolium]